MPYGRKSGLKKQKAGGGFGKSLVTRKDTGKGAQNFQKPDIGRLLTQGEEERQVTLTDFLTRDKGASALETNDLEDFIQVSLFKRNQPKDLVLCGRNGQSVNVNTAKIVNRTMPSLNESKSAALTKLELPVRPFAFRHPLHRIKHFIDFMKVKIDDLTAVDSDKFCDLATEYFLQDAAEMAPLLDADVIAFHEAKKFSEWREYLSSIQRESPKLVITPYEKNLDYWRQLWRTIERSDIVLEIVDARNPLLYRSEALEDMVKQQNKKLKLCINKTDYLSNVQRSQWQEYFVSTLGDNSIMYSSMRELKKMQGNLDLDQFVSIDGSDEWRDVLDVDSLLDLLNCDADTVRSEHQKLLNEIKPAYSELEKIVEAIPGSKLSELWQKLVSDANESITGTPKSAPREHISGRDLLHRLIGEMPEDVSAPIVVGTIGFPNVGKSSLINSLLKGSARVGVSRTPGKTRHLQTLAIPHTQITLCDCPGLVLPTTSSSREDLVLNGVMSADTYRGSMVKTIGNLLLRVGYQIADVYNIHAEFELLGNPVEKPQAVLEVLATYRGQFTSGKGGLPDVEKVARTLVKMFLDGRKLNYCEMPPTYEDSEEWMREERRKWNLRSRILSKK